MTIYLHDNGIDATFSYLNVDMTNGMNIRAGSCPTDEGYLLVSHNNSKIKLFPAIKHIYIENDYQDAICGLIRFMAQQADFPIIFQDTLTISDNGIESYNEWTISEGTMKEFVDYYNKILPAVLILR
jgi:hypothetical protein